MKERAPLLLVALCCLVGCAGQGAAGRPSPVPDPGPAAEPASVSPSPASEEGPDWAQLAVERLPGFEVCQIGQLPEKVLCGTIEVWEDRAKASGRRIPLNVVVVPAKSESPPADPVFVFEGGPGGAATKRAGGSMFSGDVRRRDIVLVDQRGTGRSNPLDCDLGGGSGPEPGELRQMFPPDDVRACAAASSERADLSLYTTEHFADDIEEVRQRLGYGPINIRGGSYGTWAMMTFAQRHPGSTRSLFGIGATSPERSNLAERGLWSEKTLRDLSDVCARQQDCGELIERMDGVAARLLASLDSGPKRVEIADPSDPAVRLTMDVSRDWLAEHLRLVLYFGFTSRVLPWALHSADALGDWEPLTQIGLFTQRMFKSNLAYGVLLTVQCSEHMDFDIEAALAQGARTLIGNYRLEQQIEGCSAWPHEKRPKLGVPEPRVLDVPALFLSGAMDPVTPPDYAEDSRRLFPNSHNIVLADGQHGPFDLEGSWECVHRVWAEFLDSADPTALDLTCTEAMRRSPFLVDGTAYQEYLGGELAAWLE